MRTVFALLLLVEGLSSGLRAAMRLPAIVVYPWLTLLVIGLRLAVAFQQFTAAWMLIGRRPPGAAMARWVYAESAALVTVELGFGLVPTSIFPAHRWWFVAFYWVYALVGIIVFRRQAED